MQIFGFVLLAAAPVALVVALAPPATLARRMPRWRQILFACAADVLLSGGGGFLAGSPGVAVGASVLAVGGMLVYAVFSSNPDRR